MKYPRNKKQMFENIWISEKKYIIYNKDGYLCRHVEVYQDLDSKTPFCLAECYMSETNSFLGPGSVEDLAKIISMASGESGTNAEYLFNLAEACSVFPRDEHLYDLNNLVKLNKSP